MKAIEYFSNGYACSESIMQEAIDKGLVSQDMLAVSTPFRGGIASGCLCGAVASSIMILGALYGRNNKFQNPEISSQKAKEFMNEFKSKHKATCCRVLTAGMDMMSAERKEHCKTMVVDCSEILERMTSEIKI